MRRPKAMFAALAAACLSFGMYSSDVVAQTRVIPRDVTNPAADVGIPELLTGIIRPEDVARIRFDALLDPSNGADASRLTAAASSIIRNHMVAQQQVELAIRFLRANREEIIAGRNATFNSIFGEVGRKQKVAILAPVPLPGNFNLQNSSRLQVRPQGGGGGGNQQAQVGGVGTQIRRGDFLFLEDNANTNNNANNNTAQRRVYPNLNSQGLVVKVAQIVENQGGTNNNNQNRNTDIFLDPTFNPVSTTTRLTNIAVWRVVRFEEQADPAVYEQVLATYLAIRDSLAGYDASLDRLTQNKRDITYHRSFRNINTEYRVGDATFTQLDSIVNNLIPGRGADRLVRQAGFSKSDSHSHLDRLEDIGNGATTDRLNRPVTPLLWTEDNDLPLAFNTRVQDPRARDEDRAFFRDRQTIFGGRDNPFDQYIGRAFLEEKILHDGDFFDTNVASDTALDRGLRSQRSPAGGVIRRTGGGNTPLVDIIEEADIPETGTPTEGKTLKKWQMLLASFAEHDEDLDERSLTNPNVRQVAALGILGLLNGAASPELRAGDAENYSLFADLLRTNGTGGMIDFSRVEPLGKRGSAGFNPVVPLN